VVLFGGQSISPGGDLVNLRDLWEWDGTQWYFRGTNGPIERISASMTFDERRGRIVLFGGQPVGTGPFDHQFVWEWDGDQWQTNLPPIRPLNYNTGARMTYDSFRGVTVFGPTEPETAFDTYWAFWDWDGTAWKKKEWNYFQDPDVATLQFTINGSLAFDSDRRRSVWFGGAKSGVPHNHTGFYDGKQWALLSNNSNSPMGRLHVATAYDSDRRATVMFGGSLTTSGAPGATNDTWELIAMDVPLINEHPASQYRPSGATAIFRVQAIGPGPISYQWYHGSIALPGENASILAVSDVRATDAGEYHVRVSNECGASASHSAVLTLDPKLQIFSSANTTTLIWSPEPNLVLETAENVTGPWAVIANAPNPLSIGAFGRSKFFRLREVE
jgi:hypothetical protein